MAQIEFAGHLIKVIRYEIFAELNFMCMGAQLLAYSNGQRPFSFLVIQCDCALL